MKKSFNVAIVGATGLVGRTMLQVLEEKYFPINNLKLLASERSAGQNLLFRNEQIIVEELGQNSFRGIDIALFSAGSYVSKTFVPIAVRAGCIVIDNGSYWRMKPDVPLIVPEVNPNEAFKHEGIITNPNCSTIQLVVALKPLLDNYGLRRVIVSTYQSISGAGQKGINKLISDISSIKFLSYEGILKNFFIILIIKCFFGLSIITLSSNLPGLSIRAFSNTLGSLLVNIVTTPSNGSTPSN